MGRQWLHAKRLVAGLKKGRATAKLVREISVAAKMGGADPGMNPRLFAAIEKALATGGAQQKDLRSGQTNLFSLLAAVPGKAPPRPTLPEIEEMKTM